LNDPLFLQEFCIIHGYYKIPEVINNLVPSLDIKGHLSLYCVVVEKIDGGLPPFLLSQHNKKDNWPLKTGEDV